EVVVAVEEEAGFVDFAGTLREGRRFRLVGEDGRGEGEGGQGGQRGGDEAHRLRAPGGVSGRGGVACGPETGGEGVRPAGGTCGRSPRTWRRGRGCGRSRRRRRPSARRASPPRPGSRRRP